jgi:hypothetical protein
MLRSYQWAALSLAACVTLAACSGQDASSEPPRQIDLAPAKQAPPQLNDTPTVAAPEPAATKTPTKKAEAPRPAPPKAELAPAPPTPVPATAAAPPEAPPAAAPAPAPTTGTVDVGTTFAVKPSSKICTSTHKPGDRFTATLDAPLKGTNGVEVPAGSVATLRIVEGTAVTRGDSIHLTYDLLSLRSGDQTYEVVAHVTESAPLERVSSQSKTDAAKKVGAGAVIGAIAGRVLGGNTKSTVIGGAIGAAAGAAVAANDRKIDGCLKTDGTITLALDRALTIRLEQTP